MMMKCAGCGMEMNEAMCSNCKSAMKCDDMKCSCEGCGKEVKHEEVMCTHCMEKSGMM